MDMGRLIKEQLEARRIIAECLANEGDLSWDDMAQAISQRLAEADFSVVKLTTLEELGFIKGVDPVGS